MGSVVKFRRRRKRQARARAVPRVTLLLPVLFAFAIPLAYLYLQREPYQPDLQEKSDPPYLQEKSNPAPTATTAHLIRVVDGDTVELATQRGLSKRVRLSNIDAPERDQPYGPYATACLADVLRNGELSMKHRGTDRYGRVLASLYVDGSRVDVQMVERGCAWWYSRYAPASLSLARAHYTARLEGRGLWAGRNPIEPERWRRERR